jgi:hypothetical protein
VTREQLMAKAREIAPGLDLMLAEDLGERTGFMLFLFDFASRQPDGKHGNMAYISNAQRADIIALLDEIKGNLQAGLTTDPPGPRGVG